MIILRPYQEECVDALLNAPGAPLGVLPTGTGKSVVIAEIIKRTPGRVLILTHVKELVEQDYLELRGMDPWIDAGLHSAGLGQRDIHNRVIFGGVQSVFNRLDRFHPFDVILIDEAHLIPKKKFGRYRKVLEYFSEINPQVKIVGLTATPFRTDSGYLHEGDEAIFTHIAFDAPFWYFIERGYLSMVTTKKTATMDLSTIRKVRGEFEEKTMSAAASLMTNQVMNDLSKIISSRKKALVFCSSVEHATETLNNLRSEGYSAELITGKTPKRERKQIVDDFKNGRFKIMVNVNVLTTGFNVKDIDLLILWRATTSPGLYVQMVGRGARIAPGKTDCLILDYGGNIRLHGPVDAVTIGKGAGLGSEEAPTKACPRCESIIHAAYRICPNCSHEFPEPESEDDIEGFTTRTRKRSAIDSILSDRETGGIIYEITKATYSWHQKSGKPKSIRVDYYAGMLKAASEWVCPFHSNFAGRKAHAWLVSRKTKPFPFELKEWDSIQKLREYTSVLRVPQEIVVKKEGRYNRIAKYTWRKA